MHHFYVSLLPKHKTHIFKRKQDQNVLLVKNIMQFHRTSTCIWTCHLNHKQTNYTFESTIMSYEKNWIKIKTPNLTQQCSNKSNQIPCSSCPKTRNPEKFKQQKLKLLMSKNWKPRKVEKLITQKTSNNKNYNSSCQQKLKT